MRPLSSKKNLAYTICMQWFCTHNTYIAYIPVYWNYVTYYVDSQLVIFVAIIMHIVITHFPTIMIIKILHYKTGIYSDIWRNKKAFILIIIITIIIFHVIFCMRQLCRISRIVCIFTWNNLTTRQQPWASAFP